MMKDITRSGIAAELKSGKPFGWFSMRILAISKKTVIGRQYMIRHKSYLNGSGREKMGRVVNTKMTLVEKYPNGALFHVNQGWNEFFTWAELAAGALRST